LEEERQIGTIARGILDELLHEDACVAVVRFVSCVPDHAGDPTDGHALTVKSANQVVPLRAGEHLVSVHQCDSTAMPERPQCLCLRRIVLGEGLAIQSVISDQRRRCHDTLQESSVGLNQRHHPKKPTDFMYDASTL
jgi:hypothetical protein